MAKLVENEIEKTAFCQKSTKKRVCVWHNHENNF